MENKEIKELKKIYKEVHKCKKCKCFYGCDEGKKEEHKNLCPNCEKKKL